MTRKTIKEFLVTQEEERIGLFAVDTINNRPSLVRVHFFFGGEGVLMDTFVDIPQEAISEVVPTDQFGSFHGKKLRLVQLVFAEGELGNIHLSNIFTQLRNNLFSEDVNSQIVGPTPIGPRSRRAAAVDNVTPRGQAVAATDVSPFTRPIS